MIIVEPKGALCNRMRVIDSAIKLGRAIGTKVFVVWIIHDNFNCSFNQLFYRLKGVSYTFNINVKRKNDLKLLGFLHDVAKSSHWDFYLKQGDIDQKLSDRFDFTSFTHSQRIYINTWSRFFDAGDKFHEFHPTRKLKQVVESYQVDSRYVGVHVRRDDHIDSITHSPLEAFIDKMETELKIAPLTQFFVASDSIEVRQLLNERFPGKVTTHKQVDFSRGSPASLQNAVIDLYCLSNCRKIIGSYASSFSETAWQIRNIDKEIILENNLVYKAHN